jgi:hypothetical protein
MIHEKCKSIPICTDEKRKGFLSWTTAFALTQKTATTNKYNF